jgi:tetratricopeptide (TPR) repeat protein
MHLLWRGFLIAFQLLSKIMEDQIMIGNTESENQILRKLSVIPKEKWIRKNHGEFIEEIIKLENHKEIVVKLIANSSWINADFRGVLDHWLATNAEKKVDVKIIHESIEIFVRVKESFANVDAGNEEIDVKKWRSNGSPFAKLLPKPIWVDLLLINKSLGLTNTVVVSIVFSCLTMYLFNKILWLSLVTGLIALMVLLWLLKDINMFIKYTKASHLFGKRKYIGAIYLYSEILNLEQELGIKDYKLVCDRADAYRKIGDSEVASGYPMMKVHQSRGYAEALKDYDRALDINCDYFPAWNNRGLVLQKLGFHQAALDSYTAARGNASKTILNI